VPVLASIFKPSGTFISAIRSSTGGKLIGFPFSSVVTGSSPLMPYRILTWAVFGRERA